MVAAYRFSHSMIRDNYWVNFNFPNASLAQVFAFIRPPVVPVHNKARRIDSCIATYLESLPGFSGMMQILATRNLLRSLALELPSGQGMASQFSIAPMTAAQLTQSLPANEVALLNSNAGLLLQKTPPWYYVLRGMALPPRQEAAPAGHAQVPACRCSGVQRQRRLNAAPPTTSCQSSNRRTAPRPDCATTASPPPAA